MAEFNIKDGVLIRANGKDKKMTVPEGVTTIAHYAFHCNTYVEQIIFPKSVTKICREAFFRCYKVKKIFVPNTVTVIEPGAFSLCFGQREDFEIEIEEGNPVYYSKNGCLIERATNKLIKGRTSCPIPEGVEIIGDIALRCP